MGIFDRFKKTAEDAASKAGDLVGEHGDKVKDGLDKAGEFVDEKTGRKHSDKINDGVDKAKDGLDKLGDNGGDAKDGDTKDDGDAKA